MTLGTTFVIMAGVLAILVAFDPYGVIGTRLLHSASMPRDARLMAGSDRLLKARAVVAEQGDALVLAGSSRVLIGFDPADPVLSGMRVYNAGLAGARLPEVLAVASRVMQRADPPGRLIVGLDFDVTLLPDEHAADWEGSALSPDGETRGAVLRRYFLSLQAVSSAATAMIGVRKFPPIWVGADGRLRYEATDSGIAGRAQLFVQETGAMVDIANAYRSGVAQRLVQRRAQVRSFLNSISLLASMRETSLKQGSPRIDILIPPMHAWRLEALYQGGLWDQYEGWKRALVADIAEAGADSRTIIRLWDFSVSHALTQENMPAHEQQVDTRWFWESSHMRPILGSKILATILRGEPADGFGTALQPATIEAHLVRERLAHEAWRRSAPDTIRFIGTLGTRPRRMGPLQ
jgi:hypothetical protein